MFTVTAVSVPVALVTPFAVTATFCASGTPERFTIISLPLNVTLDTVPAVVVAVPAVTGVVKVKTMA
jgi:hypothetical protein